jgi:hypothetical protein
VALQELATVADLGDRGIAVPAGVDADTFLGSAASAVRDAAGVPITRETVTVTIPGTDGLNLALPCQPVVSVADVLLDDTPVSDWKLVCGRLWRRAGWEAVCGEPSNVTLTITGGVLDVPKDIVDLVCALAGYGMNLAAGGDYSAGGDLVSVSIDDYTEQHGNYGAADRLAGPMELPEATRLRLQNRFGGGVVVVRSS